MKKNFLSEKNSWFIKVTLIILLLSCITYIKVRAEEIYIYVKAYDVNIRDGSSMDSKILDQVQKGEKLHVLDIKGDWYYVSYKEGKRGWIFKELITTSPEEKATQTPVAQNTPRPRPESKVVFATDDGLKIINSDGTGLQALTDKKGDNYPQWSPDGKYIVFINYREGRQLYIIKKDGSGRKKITDIAGIIPYCRYSHNNKNILFSSENQDKLYYTNIYSYDIASGKTSNLTKNKNWTDKNPFYSSDDRLIAFESRRDKNGEIYTMKSNGTEQKNITNNQGEDIICGWLQGNIIFTSNRDVNYKNIKTMNSLRDIYIIKPDGTGLTKLTNSQGDNYNPVPSPNSKYIIFISDRNQKTPELFFMKSGEKGTMQITGGGGIKSNISWSPDSSRIVFQLNQNGKKKIYTIKQNGTEKTFLSTGYSPAWCPK